MVHPVYHILDGWQKLIPWILGLGASPVSDPIMAFVASEEDEDEEEIPEVTVEVNEGEGDGKTIELIPNQDILIHKPQVRFA